MNIFPVLKDGIHISASSKLEDLVPFTGMEKAERKTVRQVGVGWEHWGCRSGTPVEWQ